MASQAVGVMTAQLRGFPRGKVSLPPLHLCLALLSWEDPTRARGTGLVVSILLPSLHAYVPGVSPRWQHGRAQ